MLLRFVSRNLERRKPSRGCGDSQIKECELAGRATKLVHKTASKVATKYSTEIVIWDLCGTLVYALYNRACSISYPVNDDIQADLF